MNHPPQAREREDADYHWWETRMSILYVVRAQPNPRGKDTLWSGAATNQQLNEEWVEFEAVGGDRNLTGDVVTHVTFSAHCRTTGSDELIKFSEGTLSVGRRLQLHTGFGTNGWVGVTFHMYLGRSWFVWNNACGDRATVSYNGRIIDSAAYAPRPPEGVLERIVGTDRLEPSYAWHAR